jgi:hypothetical protein
MTPPVAAIARAWSGRMRHVDDDAELIAAAGHRDAEPGQAAWTPGPVWMSPRSVGR